MANLPEVVQYDSGVYQIETTDPVVGGVNGISNAPLKNLTNRTAYLKAHIDALESAATGFAPINSPALTGTPTAPTQALGDSSTKIATTQWVQSTIGGRLSKSVAGNTNVTLTAVEAGNAILEFTGALTGNIAVIVPTSPTRSWIVKNSTSGAFTLTVKTAAGSGVVVTQGKTGAVYTDGTNVLACHNDYTDIAMTGVPTAPTAAVGTNTTQIATTAFVQALLSSSVPAASETVAGKVELATEAETTAGTDNTRAVTPAGLAAAGATKLRTASTINGTSFDGTANITTANWGTARTLTIGNTGKSVNGSANVSWSLAEIGVIGADSFGSSLAANGWQRLPSGLIIQWGQSSLFSSASNATVTLSIAFPTANLSVVASWSPSTGKDGGTPNIVSKSLTNFVVGTNNTNAGTVYWIAIGY